MTSLHSRHQFIFYCYFSCKILSRTGPTKTKPFWGQFLLSIPPPPSPLSGFTISLTKTLFTQHLEKLELCYFNTHSHFPLLGGLQSFVTKNMYPLARVSAAGGAFGHTSPCIHVYTYRNYCVSFCLAVFLHQSSFQCLSTSRSDNEDILTGCTY